MRGRWKRCRCGKRRFADEIEAKLVLAEILRKDSSTRSTCERRAYQCELGSWHLTSRPRWISHAGR